MTPTARTVSRPAVAIVGAGPAGLTAATALARAQPGEVLVLDREREPGGIPRHSDHTGYGLRDQRRIMKGPAYARLLTRQAQAAGARIMTQATVSGWSGLHTTAALEVTTPGGLLRVEPQAIVLATGARERPRAARMVPGDRPDGVLTTGQLQNLVHLHHQPIGTRALVVGSELVSWSAVMTLREAGCKTVLMTTEQRQGEAYLAFSIAGRLGLGVKATTRTRVTRVIGRSRVEGVEVENLDTGHRTIVPCDTVVFTGDWIPDLELARLAELDLDAGTKGPSVDTALRTSRPGVFAAGNLVHPVDTADVAALDGRHVATHVIDYLNGSGGGSYSFPVPADGAPIRADEPFTWVAPNRLPPDEVAPARGRLLLWSTQLVHRPIIEIRQGGSTIARRRLLWPAAPGRVFRVPWSLLSDADPRGGEICIGLARG